MRAIPLVTAVITTANVFSASAQIVVARFMAQARRLRPSKIHTSLTFKYFNKREWDGELERRDEPLAMGAFVL
ncbi:hypothetical protein B0H11DRAFT_2235944 [Mycena galericulata]|nr:hypothetical protein B0H11DRAFT_2235944 [Mycena galericulata]